MSSTSTKSAMSRPTVIGLLLLTLATLVLRLTGIGFGAPMWEEPDPDIPGHVDILRGDPVLALVTHPDEQYPHLVADLVRWLPGRPPATGLGAPQTVEEHLAAAAWTHVQVRRVVAVLSTLLIPLTFLLACWFVRPRWALFAAALVATSLLHQSFSQQARPHGVATTLFVWALLADLGVARRGRWRDFVHAGLASALTLGALQSGLAVLLAGVGACAVAVVRGRCTAWRVLAPVAIVAVSLPIFYPFYFDGHASVQDPGRQVDELSLRTGEHMIALSEFDGSGFAVLAKVMWNYEPLLSVLALFALICFAWLVARRRWGLGEEHDSAWVVLSFAVPYVAVCGLYGMTFERFALPMLSILATFVTWSLATFVTGLASRAARRLAVFACVGSLALPGAAVAKLAILRARPDTLGLAARWISEHAPNDTVWIAPPLDVPLARRPEGLLVHGRAPKQGFTPWTTWQAEAHELGASSRTFDVRWLALKARDMADLGGFLDSLGGGLVLIEVYESRTKHAAMTAVRRALQEKGERLARFGPDSDPETTELELFFQLSDHFNGDGEIAWPHFTRRLLSAVAIGPVIEVWRLPRTPDSR